MNVAESLLKPFFLVISRYQTILKNCIFKSVILCIISMYKRLFKVHVLFGHSFGIIWLESVNVKQEIVRFSCQWLLWHRNFVLRVSFQRHVTFISLARCLENEQAEPVCYGLTQVWMRIDSSTPENLHCLPPLHWADVICPHRSNMPWLSLCIFKSW